MALKALMALVPLMTWGEEHLSPLMAFNGIMTLVPLMMLGGDLPLSHPFYIVFFHHGVSSYRLRMPIVPLVFQSPDVLYY